MRAKALLASVLVFNFKDVPVWTFNANTHCSAGLPNH
jgi:hypothetical protein